jgi:hypothetical protein
LEGAAQSELPTSKDSSNHSLHSSKHDFKTQIPCSQQYLPTNAWPEKTVARSTTSSSTTKRSPRTTKNLQVIATPPVSPVENDTNETSDPRSGSQTITLRRSHHQSFGQSSLQCKMSLPGYRRLDKPRPRQAYLPCRHP